MLAYIAIRFRSLPFGVGAVVALIHDTLITIGILALLGREFNLVVVAALLTLVGYSVNDTVVVYDRVRENQRTPKKESLEAVINRSINQTLSRTILTSGATMLVVRRALLPRRRGSEHLRADAHHRDLHRDLLVDLRRGGDRRDLEELREPAEAPAVPAPRPAAPAPAAGEEEVGETVAEKGTDLF